MFIINIMNAAVKKPSIEGIVGPSMLGPSSKLIIDAKTNMPQPIIIGRHRSLFFINTIKSPIPINFFK